MEASSEQQATERMFAIASLLWGRELGDQEVEENCDGVRSFADLEESGLSRSAALRVLEVASLGDQPEFLQRGIFVTPRAVELQDALACAQRSTGPCAFDSFKSLPRKEFDALEEFGRFGRTVWMSYPRLVQLFGRPYKHWRGEPGTFWPVRFPDGLVGIVSNTRFTKISKVHPHRDQHWSFCDAYLSRSSDTRASGRLVFLATETRQPSATATL